MVILFVHPNISFSVALYRLLCMKIMIANHNTQLH